MRGEIRDPDLQKMRREQMDEMAKTEDARSVGTRLLASSERALGAARQAREAARSLSQTLFGPEPEKEVGPLAPEVEPEGLAHRLHREIETQAEVMDDTYRILDNILTRLEH